MKCYPRCETFRKYSHTCLQQSVKDRVKFAFECGWLLNTGLSSIQLNIWDHKILFFKRQGEAARVSANTFAMSGALERGGRGMRTEYGERN